MEPSFAEMKVYKEMLENPFGLVAREIYPMVPGYLVRRENDVDQLRILLADQKFAEIQFIAHQLKGTGAGYGFPAITEIGRELERAALQKDSENLREFIEHLSNAVKYLKQHFGLVAKRH